MKKTLIALAAVAATGAAFAQSSVSLSGSYIGGYEITNTTVDNAAKDATGTAIRNTAGKTESGLFTDTAAIKLTAVEDIGGGLKASAVVSVGGLGRKMATGGEDAYVSLDGGFGTFKLGTIENPNDLTPAWIAPGAYGLDGKVFDSNVTLDFASWTSTSMNGFKVGALWSDYSNGTKGTAGAGGTVGVIGGSQSSGGVSVSYANGPLKAAGAFTTYTQRDLSATAATSKVKASASYDLGVATVAAAFYKKSYEVVSAETGLSVGVSAPVASSLSIGAQYGKLSPKADAADKTGYSLGAQYDLSKRTNISTSLASWKVKGAADSDTAFRVLVGHSF